MVHIAAMVTPPEDVLPEVPYELRYVARQPILDIQGRVNSYELLFRAGPEKAFRGTGEAPGGWFQTVVRQFVTPAQGAGRSVQAEHLTTFAERIDRAIEHGRR